MALHKNEIIPLTIESLSSDGSGVDSMTRSAVSSLKAVTEAVRDTVGFDLTRVMDAQTIDAKVKRDVIINGGEGIDVNLHPQMPSDEKSEE